MQKKNILKSSDSNIREKRRIRRPVNTAALKTAAGLILIAASIAGIFYWEISGSKVFTYKDVITVKEDVAAGSKVTTEMLGVIRYAKDSVVSNAVTDPKLIIGKTAVVDLKSGTQLSESFFEDEDETIYTGDYIFAIPTSWMYNKPQSLRRGDTVYIYPVEDKARADYYIYSGEYSSKVESQSSIFDCSKLLIKATVCYVKDTSNKEVTDDYELKAEKRINATSPPEVIEISVKEEEYAAMVKAYANGYVFNVLYTEK